MAKTIVPAEKKSAKTQKSKLNLPNPNDVAQCAKPLAVKLEHLALFNKRKARVVLDFIDKMLEHDPADIGNQVPYAYISVKEMRLISDVSETLEELSDYMITNNLGPCGTVGLLTKVMADLDQKLVDRFGDHSEMHSEMDSEEEGGVK
jgi:hypothetical protein